MLFTNAQALEAARTLRSVLSQLLDAESAEAIDRQLVQLLNQTDLDENTQVDRILKIGVAESGDDLKMLTLAVGAFRETSLRNSSLKSATPYFLGSLLLYEKLLAWC